MFFNCSLSVVKQNSSNLELFSLSLLFTSTLLQFTISLETSVVNHLLGETSLSTVCANTKQIALMVSFAQMEHLSLLKKKPI